MSDKNGAISTDQINNVIVKWEHKIKYNMNNQKFSRISIIFSLYFLH